MAYTLRATSRAPKLVVFVVDESSSMSGLYAGVPKNRWVGDEINRQLRYLLAACMRTNAAGVATVRPWVSVSVIGYGGQQRELPELRSLFMHRSSDWILGIDELQAPSSETPRLDAEGNLQLVDVASNGWTPTAAAIRLAGSVIGDWIEVRAEAMGLEPAEAGLPAPTIIHVTDGVPTDDDLALGPVEHWANELQELATRDGATLLINVGVPDSAHALPACRFPTQAELPDIPAMKRLWSLSSPLPNDLLQRAIAFKILPVGSSAEGRRMYLQVGEPGDLSRVFEFGSDNEPH